MSHELSKDKRLTSFYLTLLGQFITLAGFGRLYIRMGRIDDLLNQVDAFIRKYYKNQMLRGAVLFVLIFAVSYLVVVGLEFVGRFDSSVRFTLLLFFLIINGYVFSKYIVFPLAKLFSFGRRINRYQAAEIIGRFFPDINDRLLNTLQLNDAAAMQAGNLELIQASVSQNAKKLTSFSFTKAVDYKENKKYAKFFIPLVGVIIVIAVFAPALFKEGTTRLVNYNELYPELAPFQFTILNMEETLEEGEMYIVEVQLTADEQGSIPSRLFIESNEGKFMMQQTAKNKFQYIFQKVNKSLEFQFLGNGYYSDKYEVDVVGRTSLGKLTATLSYPSYLEQSEEIVENVGDLIVPEGTQVEWSGVSKNAKLISVIFSDSTYKYTRDGFKVSRRFLKNDQMEVRLDNKFIPKTDTLLHRIQVIKDQYPSIQITERMDSLTTGMRYFSGESRDDYGLKAVMFHYELTNNNLVKLEKNIAVPGITGNKSPVSLSFDISKLPLGLEDEVVYYFMVYDNDGVNGSKSSKSATFRYKVPTAQELFEKRKEDKESSKEELNELLNEATEFNERIDRLKKDVLNSKNSGWKESQQLEQLKEQRSSLEKRMEQLKEKMTKSFEEKNNLSPAEERLLKKQELLEDLMDDIMDKELEDLLKQLEDLMNNQEKEGVQDVFEEMELSAEDMERQLDRTMEMLKKMDVEERIEDIQKGLDKLAEEQQELKKELEQKGDKDRISKEQERLKEEFNRLEEELEEVLEKNDELKRPLDLDELKEDRKEVNEKMSEAEENLEKKKDKKAGDAQKASSEKMKEMSDKMEAMTAKSQQQQKGEDIESLKRLLKALMGLSFSQEDVMDNFEQTSVLSPSWGGYGREQRNIMDNTKPVEDSLRALADRVPKISKFVNTELSTINLNYNSLPDDLDERRKRELGVKQQYVMTSFNNLALFLNESLEEMQREMQSMMAGSGSCDKPGGKGKGNSGEMDGLKEMLKKQLGEMEKGSNPGGEKPGEQPGSKPGEKSGGMLPLGAKEAAQMAAQQSEIRRKLEELKKDLNKDGKGTGNQLNELLKELEEQEESLINKEWNKELISRQKEIITKLLESEKALEERGFEEDRESKSGKDENFSNQIEFLEYKKRKEKQIELLRTLDPTFNKYYREKANDFYNRIY
ncbi:MAG: hypothetical protein P8O07_09075 [Crocinitomicaceae bacterium]|nr:hypothetical protein [Crocinitomicaceae bacterium]